MARYSPGSSGGDTSYTLTSYNTHTTLTNEMPNVIAVAATASLTLTLPDASAATTGKRYYIKDVTGSAGSYNITLSGSSNQKIDGLGTYVISSNWSAVGITTDGSHWYVI